MSDEDTLREIFRTAQVGVSDNGFTRDVMQRVDRLRRRRRVVLGSAIAVGAAVAVPALWHAIPALAGAPWAHWAAAPALNVMALCVSAGALWVFSVSVEA
jgi:hypothetical protein